MSVCVRGSPDVHICSMYKQQTLRQGKYNGKFCVTVERYNWYNCITTGQEDAKTHVFFEMVRLCPGPEKITCLSVYLEALEREGAKKPLDAACNFQLQLAGMLWDKLFKLKTPKAARDCCAGYLVYGIEFLEPI